MEGQLRVLIGAYGFKAVHEGLRKEMEQTYKYLRTIFEPPKNDIVMSVPVLTEMIPEPVTSPSLAPTQVTVEPEVLSLESPLATPVAAPADENIREVVIHPKGAVAPVTDEPQAQTQQQPKWNTKEHREAVNKKKAELEEKGMNPMNLLTKDNMSNWLGQGLSYQKIARETGVHENEISTLAKTMGLQSNVSKMVYFKKNAK
jgi:hypothetical protein